MTLLTPPLAPPSALPSYPNMAFSASSNSRIKMATSCEPKRRAMGAGRSAAPGPREYLPDVHHISSHFLSSGPLSNTLASGEAFFHRPSPPVLKEATSIKDLADCAANICCQLSNVSTKRKKKKKRTKESWRRSVEASK